MRTDAIHAPVVGRWCRSHDFAVQWRIGLGSNTPIKHDIAIADQRGITLRSDQADATDAFCGGGGRGLVVMPTGTGKTVVAMDIMLRLQKSTLVVVPVRDLMYQWHEKIRQATGIDAGLIGDGVHRVSPVSVTTYDSAAIHMPRIGDRFELLIFDEVHHLAGPWRSDAARMSIATHRLGLTATLPDHPERLRTLNDLVGPTVYQQSIAEASGRSLANYQIHRIAVSMSAVERERYEALSKRIQTFVFEQKELDPHFAWEDTYRLSAAGRDDPVRAQAANAAMRAFRQKRQIEEHATGKQRALEDLFRLHHGEPIIVFTGSNVMARKISTRFMVPCLLSHCGKRERREWLQGFADGQFPVLVANRVLDEGVDLPEVKTAIVLGGLSSSRQAIQRLGRVLRKGSGNQPAVLYEVVLNETKEVQRSRDRRRNDAYQMNRGGTDR
ncbi:MAG: DEAD/DEAH box helicase [Planctomycetota bacterium]